VWLHIVVERVRTSHAELAAITAPSMASVQALEHGK
jgi:hypothetical protein